MDQKIETLLMDQHPKLFLNIKKKSIDDFNLPITVGTSIIGFGKFLDFYMFWISERKGAFYFNARKKFTRTRTDNSVKIEFTEENEATIFHAMDEIYNNYLQAIENGNFQQEVQRIEEKRAIRATIAKNREASPESMLLWNDVTVSVFERSEQFSYNDMTAIDADLLTQLKKEGERVATLFDAIFHIMEKVCYQKISRKFTIYREYVDSDTITLAAIALRYDLSRERIRQIVNRVDKNLFGYFQKAMLLDNSELNECIRQLASALENVDYQMILLIAYGFTEISNRKKKAFLNMLFGKAFANLTVEKYNDVIDERYKKEKEGKDEVILKYQKMLKSWENLQSKISFPSDIQADQSISVASYEKNKSFLFEKKVYEKLKTFESLIEIIEDPDIVYYSTSKTDHRPNFLLRLPDRTSVLVLVLHPINMAYIYNVQSVTSYIDFVKKTDTDI